MRLPFLVGWWVLGGGGDLWAARAKGSMHVSDLCFGLLSVSVRKEGLMRRGRRCGGREFIAPGQCYAMLCYAMLWYNAPIHPGERIKKKKLENGKSLASDGSPSDLQ